MPFALARQVGGGADRPRHPRRHPVPRLAASLALAGAGASVLLGCGPLSDCLSDIPHNFDGRTGIPVDEPVAWIVTLCLDEECSALDVDSKITEAPDVTGSLFTRFVLRREDAVWGFQGGVAFGARTGDIRVSLAINDRATGELVLSAAVDHLQDDDLNCLTLGIEVGGSR
jgi:hypothetical protein